MNPCVPNKEVPTHQSYGEDSVARAFWRLSYRCGRNYIKGVDAQGKPVLVQHEREKEDSFQRRQRSTKPRNHCGPIIRQYNDFVFRLKAVRPPAGKSQLYDLLCADIDGHGTTVDAFMRRGLKRGQINREAYLLPDSTAPTDRTLTKAQAAEAKVRQVVRLIDADSVVWWRDVDGVLAEALVLMVREGSGEQFARFYDAKATTDIELKTQEVDKTKRTLVAKIGPAKAHKYGACPLVRLRPIFDDDEEGEASPGESQISPLAELNQEVANFLSLLGTETYDCTFSQWIASGVSAAEVKDVTVGNNRIICLPNPLAKFEALGADPAQAASIAARIEETQRELYRIAGVSAGDPLAGPGAPESGVAKAFKFNDLAANLSALADACEEAENAVMQRLFAAAGEAYPGDAKYPDEFDIPDLKEELEGLIRVMTAALPQIIKEKIALRFATRNLALDDAEKAELEQQVEEGAAASADPFNRNNPGRMTGT